jgi:hypothetical protein
MSSFWCILIHSRPQPFHEQTVTMTGGPVTAVTFIMSLTCCINSIYWSAWSTASRTAISIAWKNTKTLGPPLISVSLYHKQSLLMSISLIQDMQKVCHGLFYSLNKTEKSCSPGRPLIQGISLSHRMHRETF